MSRKGRMMAFRTCIAIGLKSFYASEECTAKFEGKSR